MKKRLFVYTILIVFTGLVGFFGVSVYMNHSNNSDITKESVEEITKICANLYTAGEDMEAFVQAGTNARITVISSQGKVLADNRPLDVDIMENHLTRPEIQAALNNMPQTFTRFSDTLKTDLIYYALKIDTGDDYIFIRAAVPVAQIYTHLFSTFPVLLFILVVLSVLYSVVIRNTVNRITKPFNSIEYKLRLLSRGEYEAVAIEGSYEEIDRITRGIEEISMVLQNSINSINDEKSKLDYIMDNISDGIFTVDKNGNIILINKSAMNIFNVTTDVIGRDMIFVTSDKLIADAVRGCVKSGNAAIFEIVHKGKIYLVTVKRLPDTNFSMAVLSDVTENRENAKHREEFFANASHELKTPLTAIKGFTELTAMNNKDENIQKYINSITRETERMLLLITDMLKISALENAKAANPDFTQFTPVYIADIIEDVKNTMSTSLSEKDISLKFVPSGDCVVNAEQGHVYDIVKNLIENAVRYNKQGGEIKITLKSQKGKTKLIVADTGIGIPSDEQARIFERFYRVEKSRSVAGGGTGLGLSIVKHICTLYNWKVSLTSKFNAGTEVTVEF